MEEEPNIKCCYETTKSHLTWSRQLGWAIPGTSKRCSEQIPGGWGVRGMRENKGLTQEEKKRLKK